MYASDGAPHILGTGCRHGKLGDLRRGETMGGHPDHVSAEQFVPVAVDLVKPILMGGVDPVPSV